MKELTNFEYTCKFAKTFLRGYHIPQRILLTPRLHGWLKRTGAHLGPNVTVPNCSIFALLVTEDKKCLITVENRDSELYFCVWDTHSYKVCRKVRGVTPSDAKDFAFSELHLLPRWRIVGLKTQDPTSGASERNALYVWSIHPMIGECAYCQVLEVKQNCFSICVDFCENVIMGITGEIGIDDLNAWKEWIVLGEPKALKCIENQNTSDVAEMPKFEVVWSRRVETPIMHVTRLKDGKLLGYLSFVGYHEIMFQFSIWELQMPEVNVKLLASKLFSGSDICNYHITCCTSMTFTAEYFATGHKNGEIYIWSYDPDIEGNLNYKLLADDDVQKKLSIVIPRSIYSFVFIYVIKTDPVSAYLF